MKGINLFGNELKLSQFADDTNLFCADLIQMEKAFNIVSEFGKIAGLLLTDWREKRQRRFGLGNGQLRKPSHYE